ncbi:MAG: CDP-alcohol phosphatidyltransferase family protein [Thermodesulfovibrionales bacterium]
MKVLTAPNIITFIRIVLIPVFVTALVYRRYEYALLLFIAAAVTDALDGLLARVTNQKTELGAFLDPLADKFLLVTSFILFSVYGWIPTWLSITVISRDLIVTLGWVILYLLSHLTRVEPSVVGKAAIASQLVLIAYTLLAVNYPRIPLPGSGAAWIVALLTIFSGVQYVYRGLKDAGAK